MTKTMMPIHSSELNNETQKKKFDMLKSIINEQKNFIICDEIYKNIINEYEEYCKDFIEKKVKIYSTQIEEYNNDIKKYKEEINNIKLFIDSDIEKDIESIMDSKDIIIALKEKNIYDYFNNEIINRGTSITDLYQTEIFEHLLIIVLKKQHKRHNEIIDFENNIEKSLLEIESCKDRANELYDSYYNRYKIRFMDYVFSEKLINLVQNNNNLLFKSFSIIRDNEKNLCKIYDKILYMFSNCEIYVKNEERILMSKEWFIELSQLTLFQFEKGKEYFKSNSFITKNPLKEFKEKANEIKNIQFLLSL